MNVNSLTGSKPEVNVSNTERVISAIAGSLLVFNAISKPGNRVVKAGAGVFLLYRAISGNCPAYSYAGKRRLPDPVKNINVRASVLVNKPRAEVYAFWRSLENLPLFMKHLKSVEETGDGKSHWVAAFPGLPGTISWDAAIVKEEENRFLGWNSLPGATIDTAGKVEFTDAGAGMTEVNTVITYRAPLGPVGEQAGRLLNPVLEEMIQNDLLQFSSYFDVIPDRLTEY
ncbi:YgaP-like transmembrane domain [Filimonas effusa]|uniref:DUF2892 domain-containing protein n=1 Tax=Filimonas effusa TaxID=2508721 RepID=A0A4V1MAN0_9BACT|nr:YgaP-like transmembrane domain [Filimonas effusa]RXK86446.1 DUF2892 domain-containing protein [Filimonas effusa]